MYLRTDIISILSLILQLDYPKIYNCLGVINLVILIFEMLHMYSNAIS